MAGWAARSWCEGNVDHAICSSSRSNARLGRNGSWVSSCFVQPLAPFPPFPPTAPRPGHHPGFWACPWDLVQRLCRPSPKREEGKDGRGKNLLRRGPFPGLRAASWEEEPGPASRPAWTMGQAQDSPPGAESAWLLQATAANHTHTHTNKHTHTRRRQLAVPLTQTPACASCSAALAHPPTPRHPAPLSAALSSSPAGGGGGGWVHTGPRNYSASLPHRK